MMSGFPPASQPYAQGYTNYQSNFAQSPGYQGQVAQSQSRGLGTGAAVGVGVGALAAGGLAGYALAGGFSRDADSPDHVQVADFGGDDWME